LFKLIQRNFKPENKKALKSTHYALHKIAIRIEITHSHYALFDIGSTRISEGLRLAENKTVNCMANFFRLL
jgi:hypothetical protein